MIHYEEELGQPSDWESEIILTRDAEGEVIQTEVADDVEDA